MGGNRKKRKFMVTDLHLCTMVFYVIVVLGCLEFSVQSQRYVCSDMYVPICLYLLLSRGNQTPVDITSLSELNPTYTIEGPVSDMQSCVVMVLTLWFSKSLLLFHLVDFSPTYE